MYEVKMPRLSDSMEVGQIIEWKVEEGDEVEQGQNLADVESDKAVMELECFHDGTIADIAYGDGAEVEVGEVIAHIAEPGEQIEGAPEESGEPDEEEEAGQEEEAPEEKKEEEEKETSGGEEEPEAEREEEVAPEAEEETEPAPAEIAEEQERVKISPYARKLAEQEDVDYAQLEGSGPEGRIIARDIKAEMGEESSVSEETTEDEQPAGKTKKSADRSDEELFKVELEEGEAEVEDAPFRMKTQARYVTAAKHVVPHFYVTRSVEVSALMERQQELKDEFGASLTHVIMLACAETLAEHPDLNRSYEDGKIIDWNDINLGLAVDTEDGLTVAVLKDAGELRIEDVAERTSALVEKARNNKLSADERKHPTFVITNLGMFDVEEFQAILNPPAAVTVAVSSALPKPVVQDGEVTAGTVMKLTLSCDHRIVEGAAAGRFLSALRSRLEDPDSFLPSP